MALIIFLTIMYFVGVLVTWVQVAPTYGEPSKKECRIMLLWPIYLLYILITEFFWPAVKAFSNVVLIAINLKKQPQKEE